MLAFNFNPNTNTHVFCEGQFAYWDVQIPVTISDKSSGLIYLIRNLLQSKDAKYSNIYKAICFLEPAMSQWTRAHFQNFLGRHDADEYSSDSDQDESDALQYQNDHLSENILNSNGSFPRDSLETRIKTLASKAKYQNLSENSVKGFNDSAAERQSYFPNNPVVDNSNRVVDATVEYELRLINEALAADVNYKVMLGSRPVAPLHLGIIYLYQDRYHRLFYSVNSLYGGDVFDIVFDDLSKDDIDYIIRVWNQHHAIGKHYLEDTRAISIILVSTWKRHHTKENFNLKFVYENEKKHIHITSARTSFDYRLTRSYYLPLFRGISYLVDRWSAGGRRKHRRLALEKEYIHYSESIIKTVDSDFYHLDDYLHIDQSTLHENARKLKEVMLELKRSENTTQSSENGAKLRAFDNLLYQFQYAFSNGIENFLKLIEQFNRDYPGVFPSNGNPFVPFGHLPFHAVKYAFGDKKPYKNFSLMPLWDAHGRPRKPHIGKLYIFLHKLEDFLNFDEPNNVPFLSQNLGVTPSFDVSPEYEISFLAFTKKERLFKQRIIRYPNFNYDYAWFNIVWIAGSSDQIPDIFDPKMIILQEKPRGNGYTVTVYWINPNGRSSSSLPRSKLDDIRGYFPTTGSFSNSLDVIEKITAKFNITYYKQDKYLAKYGLTWNLFILFKSGICNINTQKETTEVLKEWLLLFHAIKAMHEAQSEISRVEPNSSIDVCIFRHPDGAYRVFYPQEGSYINSEAIRKSEDEAKIHLGSSENHLLIQAERYSDKRKISLFSPSLNFPCKTPLKTSIKRQSFSSSQDRVRNSGSIYSSVSSTSSQNDTIDDSFTESFERMLSVSIHNSPQASRIAVMHDFGVIENEEPDTYAKNIAARLTFLDDPIENAQERNNLETAKQESLLLTQQQAKIGPRFIEEWRLQDVEDKGNCFYQAIIEQMKIINHSFLASIPIGALAHDSLRLRIQRENFQDREWDTQEILQTVIEFNIVIAIVDTRHPDVGFRCYYPASNRNEAVDTNSPAQVPESMPIIRLAYTGDHYLSVQTHPSLNDGAIRSSFTDPWLSLISSSTKSTFWSRQMTNLHEKHHKKSSCIIS